MRETSSEMSFTFHLPSAMLADIEKYSDRLQRSSGWCLRMAWGLAAPEIERLHADDLTIQNRILSGNRHPQPVALPPPTWDTIREEAARLDRSPSWLVQQAWRIARPFFLQAAR